jgi:hypothetical protein
MSRQFTSPKTVAVWTPRQALGFAVSELDPMYRPDIVRKTADALAALDRLTKATQALLAALYDNRSQADEFAEAEDALSALGAP